MTTKKLIKRQACWEKFLSSFNFVNSYIPEKKNQKVDLLTCYSNNLLLGKNNDH